MKKDIGVRVTHIPTGIVINSGNERSQEENLEVCMRYLRAKLYALEHPEPNPIVRRTWKPSVFEPRVRW